MKLKNIKNSFNNREINPSTGAWDQLAARLDQEEKNKKKPFIYWLGAIAAIFILGVVLYPFLNGSSITLESNENTIVLEDTTPTKESTGKKSDIALEKKLDFEEKTESSVEKQLIKNTTLTAVSEKRKQKRSSHIASVSKTIVNKQIVNEESTVKEIKPNSIIEDSSINPLLSNPIAQTTPKKLTAEEEMELLLNEAMQNTPKTVIATKEYNIDQLVRESEWDIEADRRNRVNNLIFDQLGRLKAEAVVIISGNK
ncbi:hypothetical protein [uncultured Nonlabens sp.]|uniref:hypothetical protein n=1 Tax=uncultured Nonlabens sp. TaxID=859306 RepID=UPI0026360A9A|nr:hypothetical protein [uncultured Nonlabens sp.]